MLPWKRTINITSWGYGGRDDTPNPQMQAPIERLGRIVERIAKGALAVMLYGSSTLVVSGVLFYFSWKLGLAALFVLSGFLPLAASVYLLWRLMRRGRPVRRWRYRAREMAIIQLAQRLDGRLTVADVVVGTGLTLQEAEATLNELVRKGYVDLHISPSGVLVYDCFPLSGASDKEPAERVIP